MTAGAASALERRAVFIATTGSVACSSFQTRRRAYVSGPDSASEKWSVLSGRSTQADVDMRVHRRSIERWKNSDAGATSPRCTGCLLSAKPRIVAIAGSPLIAAASRGGALRRSADGQAWGVWLRGRSERRRVVHVVWLLQLAADLMQVNRKKSRV